MSKQQITVITENAQEGESISADFSEGTWVFKMPEGFNVRKGKYLIVPFIDIVAIDDEE